MRAFEAIELVTYAVVIAYFIGMQRKLSGRNAAALEFRHRLEERRKAGRFSLSIDDHKKLNWLAIAAGVLLSAITIFNALKR